jgi:hypothetical protein
MQHREQHEGNVVAAKLDRKLDRGFVQGVFCPQISASADGGACLGVIAVINRGKQHFGGVFIVNRNAAGADLIRAGGTGQRRRWGGLLIRGWAHGRANGRRPWRWHLGIGHAEQRCAAEPCTHHNRNRNPLHHHRKPIH